MCKIFSNSRQALARVGCEKNGIVMDVKSIAAIQGTALTSWAASLSHITPVVQAALQAMMSMM